MYTYLLGKWGRNEISEEQLQIFVPFFISQDEYNQVIQSSQNKSN